MNHLCLKKSSFSSGIGDKVNTLSKIKKGRLCWCNNVLSDRARSSWFDVVRKALKLDLIWTNMHVDNASANIVFASAMEKSK